MVQTSTVPALGSLHKTNKRSKKAQNQPLGKESTLLSILFLPVNSLNMLCSGEVEHIARMFFP